MTPPNPAPKKKWTDKPNAKIHGEIYAGPDATVSVHSSVPVHDDRTICDRLHAFCVENPLPRWQFHPDEPPYPSLNQFHFYYERGNPFIVCFDEDGMIWHWRIISKRTRIGIWWWFRREEDALHEPLGDNPFGGLTRNVEESLAEGDALTYHLAGEVLPQFIAGNGANPNVAALGNQKHDANYERGVHRYQAKYAHLT